MFWAIVRVVLLVYLGFGLLMLIGQTRMLFPAGGSIWQTPADHPFRWAYEDIVLPVNNKRTHAWFISAPNSRGVVLFSHGNAGTIANRLESVDVFHTAGFDVLLYDYGGYGNSTGKPSEKRCYADIRAMWQYLTEERKVAPARIVLFGRSVGAGPTVQLATEVEPRAVILESAFLSVAKMAQEMLRVYPTDLLVRHKFNNAKKIKRITCPILVVHSPEDDIVPFHHGKKLFELANEPKTFLEIIGDHNEGWHTSGVLYRRGIHAFLNSAFETVDEEENPTVEGANS